MKKTYKRGAFSGYEIGPDIQVHHHIHFPEDFVITIRKLGIFSEALCRKTCTEEEIQQKVAAVLQDRLKIVNGVIDVFLEETRKQ